MKKLKIVLAVVVAFVAGMCATVVLQKLNERLYEPSTVWCTALFVMDEGEDVWEHDYSNPDYFLTPKTALRTRYHHTTGYADPFLFVNDGWLYLFYERELYDAPGVIDARRTRDLKHWEDLGTVLTESYHLSYPNVYQDIIGGGISMIPETHCAEAVIRYEAEDFPYGWKAVDTLAKGHLYCDSDIFEVGGHSYMFSTVWKPEVPAGLHLFVLDSLAGGYVEHPCSPVSDTLMNLRSGGAMFEIDDTLYRPAQDCVDYYGKSLGIYRVDEITDSTYRETLVKDMHPTHSYDWDANGGHHFNTVIFNGKRIVVMDGKQKDNWLNNRTRWMFRKR